MILASKFFKLKGWDGKVFIGIGKYVYKPFIDYHFYFLPTVKMEYERNRNLYGSIRLTFKWMIFYTELYCDYHNNKNARELSEL